MLVERGGCARAHVRAVLINLRGEGGGGAPRIRHLNSPDAAAALPNTAAAVAAASCRRRSHRAWAYHNLVAEGNRRSCGSVVVGGGWRTAGGGTRARRAAADILPADTPAAAARGQPASAACWGLQSLLHLVL